MSPIRSSRVSTGCLRTGRCEPGVSGPKGIRVSWSEQRSTQPSQLTIGLTDPDPRPRGDVLRLVERFGPLRMASGLSLQASRTGVLLRLVVVVPKKVVHPGLPWGLVVDDAPSSRGGPDGASR